MGLSFKAGSLLAFVFALSLIVYFFGIYDNRLDLSNAAVPFLWLFGGIWLIFVLFSIGRNAKRRH